MAKVVVVNPVVKPVVVQEVLLLVIRTEERYRVLQLS
jgi:hypothetical protein